MEKKGKRFLIVLIVSILSVLSIVFFLVNISTILSIRSLSSRNNFQDIINTTKLEASKWRYETELEYMDNYCEILSQLPNEQSKIANVTVNRYEKRLPISSVINPYPGNSSLYEIGFVTSSDFEDIKANGTTIKLYRIELNEDPNVYIEYISDRNTPHLYVVKDIQSDSFLLYPILNYLDSDYYINIE